MTRRTTIRLSVGFGGTSRRDGGARARQRLVRRLAQHQERALGGHGAERHVDDAVQDVGQRLCAEQRAAHVGEQPDELALADASSRPIAADMGCMIVPGPSEISWSSVSRSFSATSLLEDEHHFAEPDRGADFDDDLVMNGAAPFEKRAEAAAAS